MSLCKDCISGVRHEGESEGEFARFGGIDCYIGTPRGEYDKTTALLFLSDAFGISFKNNQLLVDGFARNGYRTIALDYFIGNPVPVDALIRFPDAPGYGEPGTFDIMAWAQGVIPGIRPAIDNVIVALKEDGITKFAATGYCIGGRFVFDLAFENIIRVAIASHPSLLKIPNDLEAYATKVTAPLLLNTCEVDPQFNADAQSKADEILGGGKFTPGYERTYWPGCHHGFAVRGDLSKEAVKKGKEGAFEASVKFLKQHL